MVVVRATLIVRVNPDVKVELVVWNDNACLLAGGSGSFIMISLDAQTGFTCSEWIALSSHVLEPELHSLSIELTEVTGHDFSDDGHHFTAAQ